MHMQQEEIRNEIKAWIAPARVGSVASGDATVGQAPIDAVTLFKVFERHNDRAMYALSSSGGGGGGGSTKCCGTGTCD